MHCRNCNNEINEKAKICPKCGCEPFSETKFCQECGEPTTEKQKICLSCGCELKSQQTINGEGKDWLTTLLICLFAGGLGIHRFYTGHTGIGIVQLLTLGGCGVWCFIDLIMIITQKYKDSDGNLLVKK